MGKICDPPPFNGGQCVGVGYYVELKCYYINGEIRYAVDENVSKIPNTRWGYVGATGPIKNVSIKYDYQWYGVALTKIYINGFYATYVFPISSVNPNIYCYRAEIYRVQRKDWGLDNCGDPPNTNCRCTPDSCRVDCATAPDGFCCIDHAVTNRLLQTLQG